VRLISRRHKSGGLAAPPPIVGRIFQELSNGCLAFEGAKKVATIPFPFPYAQIVQYLQLAFVLSCPFVVVAFVDELFFQMFFTFLGVFTFTTLNAVASQLEDPFGHDSNDLPMRELHRHFVCNLSQLTHSELNDADLHCLEAIQSKSNENSDPDASPSVGPEKDDAFDDASAKFVAEMNMRVSTSNGAVLHEEALRKMFDDLDKNGNGVLDHGELKVLCTRIGVGFSDDKYHSMLKKVDPDSTGEVDFDAIWKWFMKKHKKAAKKQAKNGATSPRGASPESPVGSP